GPAYDALGRQSSRRRGEHTRARDWHELLQVPATNGRRSESQRPGNVRTKTDEDAGDLGMAIRELAERLVQQPRGTPRHGAPPRITFRIREAERAGAGQSP